MADQNRFAEWAVVYGEHYGTERNFLDKNIKSGVDVLLNLDIQGHVALKKQYLDSVSIFIHTPSFEELKKRLVERRSESESSIQKRLRDAEEELKASSSYDFHLVNDNVSDALRRLIGIIEAQRNKP